MKVTVERRPHPRSYQMLANAYFEAGQREEALEVPAIGKSRSDFELHAGRRAHLRRRGRARYRRTRTVRDLGAIAHPRRGRACNARERLSLQRSARPGRDTPARGPSTGASTGLGSCVNGKSARSAGTHCRRHWRTTDGRSTCNRAISRRFDCSGSCRDGPVNSDAAVKTFRRAIELYPKSSRDHYLLGRALAAMGQIAAAVPYFAQAVVLDPQNAEARADLRRAERDATTAAGVRR